MQYENIYDINIKNFIENLKQNMDFSFKQPERKIRRDPDGGYVNNIEKKDFPVFEIIKKEKLYLHEEILFLGFVWNNITSLFDAERLLIPLYFSFYLEKPVYIFLEPRYFKVDYLKGITKILDEKLIPPFEIIISRSAELNKYIKLSNTSNTKDIVITPVNSYNQKCDFMYSNSFLFKHPDPGLILKFKNTIENRNNFILFNGTLWNFKGQYFFLQHVDTDLIKNYTLIFVGGERKHTFKQCIELAKKRNISLICVPFIKHNLLHHIVPKCKYQISLCCLSELDPNPRSITEGLFAGLPFLVSDYTIIPNLIQNNSKIGLVCKNNDINDLNNKLKILLTLKNKDVIDFIEKKCNYNDICKYTTENIINKYTTL